MVSAGLVVEDSIKNHLHVVVMQSLYRLFKFRACAVFGTYRTFLVEFSEVVQVIRRISLVLLFIGLICGRNPYGGDADVGKVSGIFLQLTPQLAVVWKIPFKILKQNSVFHNFYELLMIKNKHPA